jgi:hypothetical protein
MRSALDAPGLSVDAHEFVRQGVLTRFNAGSIILSNSTVSRKTASLPQEPNAVIEKTLS